MDPVNILIIGGGVVGCAVAEALSRRWQEIFLVEQFPKFGMSTSTRNSGVIHSGIYYPTNSWKAKHCVEGNRLTTEFCAKNKVPYRVTGKLVVAKSPEEEPQLLALMKKGQENGVAGLRIIDGASIREREPHVQGYSALLVPSTGICSAEELVHAYARLAEQQGANLLKRAKVAALEPQKDLMRVTLRVGDEQQPEVETVEARCVVNAAGLSADDIAKPLDDLSRARGILRNSWAASGTGPRPCLSVAAHGRAFTGLAFHQNALGNAAPWADGEIRG